MDALNINYNQDDIHLNKRDAYHLKRVYFEFDKKDDMASCLSLSYQAMENVLQELDGVVKDESTSLSFVIYLQKMESLTKNSMINQQVSLGSQMLKNPKSDNAQHVPEIVELDDFDTKEMKVVEKQHLKPSNKTLLSLEAFEKKNKQATPIETHEENNPTSLKKNCG
jgi:hypothetical protein